MLKYVQQEMSDLNGTGETQSYYRAKTYTCLGTPFILDYLAECCGTNRGVARLVIQNLNLALRQFLTAGHTVRIDGLGTFALSLGVRPDMPMDSLDGDDPDRNAQTVVVRDLRFRPDQQFLSEIRRSTQLERDGKRRLHRSKYSREERLALAQEFLAKNGVMNISDYAGLTGLSQTAAGLELREFRADEATGIGTIGRATHILYVRKDK